MTVCSNQDLEFTRCKSRKVQANFNGGNITSDGGVMLLKQTDKLINMTPRIAAMIDDPRCKGKVDHPIVDMLRQRVYGLAMGYEDVNDHTHLRKDIAIQTAVGSDKDLASSSTLNRFENSVDEKLCKKMNSMFVEFFIESFERPPEKVILDFDPTDCPVYGNQAGKFFHGYYKHYCFLPLYVFSGKHLLAACLKPADTDPSKGALDLLKSISERIREEWPDVKIIFRADSGFCRHHLMDFCDEHDIGYIIGIGKNPRLRKKSKSLLKMAKYRFEALNEKLRLFGEFQYGAESWKYERRIIAKLECSDEGISSRFLVTNITGNCQDLYENLYCARGEAENRIKAQQMDLFSDRTSCTKWFPNQFRILMSGLAYILMEAIRRLSLSKTELAFATCGSIRLKLLKIGAVVTRNTRRVRMLLSSSYPYQKLFRKVVCRLDCY